MPWRIYAKSLIFIAIFYVNYYVIIDRCLGRRHWVWRLIGFNTGVALLAIVTLSILFAPPVHHRAEMPGMPLRIASVMVRDAMMVVLTIGLSVAVKLGDYMMRLQQQRSEMIAAQRKEELDSLKRQLNPHFLFNTLNSIYALVAISPEKAQTALHELSRLLRYVLYENEAEVSLDEELNFVDNYLRLQRLRLGDTPRLEIDIRRDNIADIKIAPLIFISPIENAIKYGNTGRDDAFISIKISCHGDTVEAKVSNRFIPSDKSVDGRRNASGIGHENLRRRLDLIYGHDAILNTRVEGGDIYIVELTINTSHRQ